MNDFDWDDLGPESIVVEHAAETAIYWNTKGDLALRQRSIAEGDDDQVVVIPRHRIEALIDRMQVLLHNASHK